ncbi:MAG: bifunctional demethylmenaquinone methyltransferase/2-methoxy-6-polyprenyl-1,4-benzoquinol methylase UbiE [Pelagibacteraceae bacterium]|nr:bifunctional demethylmenaquinone methyltransferase/2-methoxy-6-polyprenyl-1,4-benzoquinol methylase UbiE [Pelagibacteraceae bacterium]|tara:strand:+ start:2760 stop:3461 length:702 start_codon:yes stop_codon:yes gene_type:complete
MKKEKVNKIFESIANKYDLMNDLMSLGIHRKWKRDLVKHLDLDKNKNNSILDLGCGTGDIISNIIKSKKNLKFQAYLVDPNIKMIEEGKKKLKQKNLIWLSSYGENLPFKNNKFDLVTMAFSLRNVENIKKTLNEVNRVLKKNGQFICLEFGKVKNLAVNSIYKIYSENLIPEIGEKITGNKDAYTYLIESIKKFPSQEEICKILKLKNFYNVKYYELSFGVAVIYSCKKKNS